MVHSTCSFHADMTPHVCLHFVPLQLLREIEVHSSIVHNNIVALYAAFKVGRSHCREAHVLTYSGTHKSAALNGGGRSKQW